MVAPENDCSDTCQAADQSFASAPDLVDRSWRWLSHSPHNPTPSAVLVASPPGHYAPRPAYHHPLLWSNTFLLCPKCAQLVQAADTLVRHFQRLHHIVLGNHHGFIRTLNSPDFDLSSTPTYTSDLAMMTAFLPYIRPPFDHAI
ncbi:hypothetical protein COCSADRAFT_255367 [Bipolaris sorokiniana ND90Pr]|uniref:Uncharacterized protein n=1 Tax=Cochliobolus sativus (strain ND90Pr / ATCC 201652) TaxID=665912 RepID=M2S9C0_COCSN|nr:uncharacterized protein COCSADRAFT_255367 [Bipolaris sorokiniana ND90Pr]EMD59145.1 hypothetical protein COCSADRAFT_255367 [Bipolaris sorokiniana ND90Pr]